jgi:polyhydroxybutyrate depolymerase
LTILVGCRQSSGPQLRKLAGPVWRKSGGYQSRKLAGSVWRKFGKYAYALGLKTRKNSSYFGGKNDNSVINQNYVDARKVAFIFPQGLSHPNKPGFTGWSNTLMTTNHNDVLFLKDLASTLRAQGFRKVFLMGHSMGGSMTNIMYCEHPTAFDGYIASAGPMPITKNAGTRTRPEPCVPNVARPHMHFAPLDDTVIGLNGKTSAPITQLDAATFIAGGGTWAGVWQLDKIEFVNELVLSNNRALIRCDSAKRATTSLPHGSVTNYCSGSIRIRRINGANHWLRSDNVADKCIQSLIGTYGLLNEAISFMREN